MLKIYSGGDIYFERTPLRSKVVPVYKVNKLVLVSMCLFRKFQLPGLRSRQKRSPECASCWFFIVKTLQKLRRDEYFGGKRNDASGTL
jgi:hypothetical protein